MDGYQNPNPDGRANSGRQNWGAVCPATKDTAGRRIEVWPGMDIGMVWPVHVRCQQFSHDRSGSDHGMAENIDGLAAWQV